MMDALYPEQWYNKRNFTEDELGYVLHENRLLGAARLRQVCSVVIIIVIIIIN